MRLCGLFQVVVCEVWTVPSGSMWFWTAPSGSMWFVITWLWEMTKYHKMDDPFNLLVLPIYAEECLKLQERRLKISIFSGGGHLPRPPPPAHTPLALKRGSAPGPHGVSVYCQAFCNTSYFCQQVASKISASNRIRAIDFKNSTSSAWNPLFDGNTFIRFDSSPFTKWRDTWSANCLLLAWRISCCETPCSEMQESGYSLYMFRIKILVSGTFSLIPMQCCTGFRWGKVYGLAS